MSGLFKKVLVALAVAIAASVVVLEINARRQRHTGAGTEVRRSPTALRLKYTAGAHPTVASEGNLVDAVITQGELSEWFQFKGDGRDVIAPLRNKYWIGGHTRIVLSISSQTNLPGGESPDGGLWVYNGRMTAGEEYSVDFAAFKYWSERKVNSKRP